MDSIHSKSQLDYALFQLTPTRTRCDLVICVGDCKEKLASGLLSPFIAHLQFAKDQISKGGYSITLSASAPWFTKSTLERFVRFVSTPEVLERSITIEREIANIELSLNTNTPSDSQSLYGLEEHLNKSSNSAYKHEGNTDDAVHEEDSKVHLQRVLENRKTILQKEQAMVYARALVAGFETDNLEDLISFSDAFGSPRLREACLNFMELCNTKSNDRVWMDEVAAIQAYSCSQSSYIETSGAILFPEENDPTQELRVNVQNGNFATKKQNSGVDIHTYHGNPMFHLPYQGYPFPPMVIPPYYQQNLPFQDFKSRGKVSQKKESHSSDSSSVSETRSSSRKIVIRNINYINSERDLQTEHKSDENLEFEDKREGEKVTQQWDIFQNLLMKDTDDKESEEFVSNKFEEQNINQSGRHKEGDWISDKTVHEKSKDIFEDNFQSTESRKDVLVDDSLAIQDHSLNKSSESHLRTQEVLMVSDNLTHKTSYSTNKNVNEPNDLYMVLERETAGKETMPTWTPEMELGNNDVKIIKQDSIGNKKSTKSTPGKHSTIETKSKALSERKSKSDVISRNKKPIAKGKSDKEEEKRKRMEELLIQRQKRISERSASATNKSKSQLASQDMKKSNKPVIKSSTINRLSTARVINPKVLPTESKPVYKPIKVSTKKITESKPAKIPTKKISESKPAKIPTKKISESKPTKLPTKKIPESKPAKVPTKKISESKPAKVVTKKNFESKPAKMATKKTNEQKPAKIGNKKIVESKPAKIATKNIDSKNSKDPKKVDIMNNVKQLPIIPPNHQSTQSENAIKTSSSVVQEDKAIPLNNGGLSKKALNTVTFKIDEDHGVKENPNFKLNHEISMLETTERNISRKKWSSFETSSKALSGFKKLLSFGRRR
ncbi:unnamed protein product [Lactuca saligna]|uniref:COP1-interacting protein 7 n=1 Tax=Lactuca saligna TaxID=75948 RepID=A0AA35V7K9_LACSI|nr:unnamed protein product [Lactuca saligna]